MKTADLERECVEERCVREEIDEYYEDDELTTKFYEQSTHFCSTGKLAFDKEKGENVPIDDSNHLTVCQQTNSTHPELRTKTCQNYWRSFTCICNEGYYGEFCEHNLDECTMKRDGTLPGEGEEPLWRESGQACTGVCRNTDNCWVCDPIVSTRKWAKVKDKDGVEIDINGLCYRDVALKLGITEGDFDAKTATFVQEDRDECKEGNVCGANAICINIDDGYECQCEDGFSKPEGDLKADCTQVDECADGSNPCGLHSTCRDLDPLDREQNPEGLQYSCDCDDGYNHGFGDTLDRLTCSDIDECLQSPCPDEATCSNIDGSFKCLCNNGGVHDKITGLCCQNGFEAKANPDFDNCDDIFGCPEFVCVDKNECDLPEQLCDITKNTYCENTIGSYKCACTNGYEPVLPESDAFDYSSDNRSDAEVEGLSTELTCKDVDECLSNPCHEEAECINTEGSFECICPSGFRTDLETGICIDIDECTDLEFPHDCDLSDGSTFRCVNKPGSFICEGCPVGQELDLNGECVDENECLENNGGCDHICVNNDFAERTCQCNLGFALNADGVSCDDVDECALETHECSGPGSSCLNTIGSYECNCSMPGFELDSDLITCVDIDECANNTHDCDLDTQFCQNLDGAYECVDKPAPVTGCPVNNKCEHGCELNEDGSYTCVCWNGYVLGCDESSCIPPIGEFYFDTSDEKYQADSCPAGFLRLGGIDSDSESACFMAAQDKADQMTAKAHCESLGATLAVIQNKEQNFYISQWVGIDNIFWIGAEHDSNMDFVWPSGQGVDYANWAKDEPSTLFSNSDDEAEACVVSNWGHGGEWNDWECDHEEALYACSI